MGKKRKKKNKNTQPINNQNQQNQSGVQENNEHAHDAQNQSWKEKFEERHSQVMASQGIEVKKEESKQEGSKETSLKIIEDQKLGIEKKYEFVFWNAVAALVVVIVVAIILL